MYPADNILRYGESSPAIAMMFVFLKFIGFNDIYGYWVLISTLFGLTAFSIYFTALTFTGKKYISIAAPFFFCCSTFIFAQIDDPVIIFCATMMMSFAFLKKYYSTGKDKYLLLSSTIGAVTIYFSIYIFVYQSILLSITAIFNETTLKDFLKKRKEYLKPFLLYLAIPFPALFFHIYNLLAVNISIPSNPYAVAKILSLDPRDLFKVLPNNLIYPEIDTSVRTYDFDGKITLTLDWWNYMRHSLFPGLVFTAGTIFGLIRCKKENWFFLTLLLTGIILALGPELAYEGLNIPMPLWPVYNFSQMFTFLRVPLRGWILFMISGSILSTYALIELQKYSGKFFGFIFAFIVVFSILEHTPFPFQKYSAEKYTQLPKGYGNVINNNMLRTDDIILKLPSRLTMKYLNDNTEKFTDVAKFVYRSKELPLLSVIDLGYVFHGSENELFEYNREIYYMNWQTIHKLNIINGVNGYFPVPRMIFNRMIMELPDRKYLKQLHDNGVSVIIYHKDMLLSGEESILEEIKKLNITENVYEDNEITVLRIKE
jgi:hypothetical protein